MQDIAKRAGVSSATVSRVLNNKSASIPISEKTWERVINAAREMGYNPNLFAKSLRTNRTSLIGIVVWELTDPFFSQVLVGIESALKKAGYTPLLTSAESDATQELRCLERLKSFRVDGYLIVGGAKAFSQEQIDAIGVDPDRVVLVGTKSDSPHLRSVTVDNVSGGRIGTTHLLEGAPRHFLYIAGRHMTYDMEGRLHGVRSAVADAAFEGRISIVHEGPGEEPGYSLTRALLGSGAALPLAVFAVSDITALGVLRAVRDEGLDIPSQVRVLGFDDLSIAGYFEPRLSTIHQPRREMGEHGAQLLLQSFPSFESFPSFDSGAGEADPDLGAREPGADAVAQAGAEAGTGDRRGDSQQRGARVLKPRLIVRESA